MALHVAAAGGQLIVAALGDPGYLDAYPNRPRPRETAIYRYWPAVVRIRPSRAGVSEYLSSDDNGYL